MLFHSFPTRLGRGAVAGMLFLTLAAASNSHAQSSRLTARLVAGATSPSGSLKDVYGAGGLGGVQAAVTINSRLSATVSTTWANAPTRRSQTLPAYAFAWTYDGGLEFRIAETSGAWTLSPFVGAGVGSRSYVLPDPVTMSVTGLAGFGSVGTDIGKPNGRWGFRAEVRGYQASYSDLERRTARANGNDLNLMVGISRR